MAESELSAKQRVFVESYLTTWNASEAARQAGYTGQANVVGPRLLANVRIAEEIRARLAERVMTANEVLDRLSEQARSAHSAYFQPDGTVDLEGLIRDGKAHLIKKIKPTRWGNEIEFYDAHAARELIGKHHGIFVDRHEHTGKDGEPLAATVQVHMYVPDNGRDQ